MKDECYDINDLELTKFKFKDSFPIIDGDILNIKYSGDKGTATLVRNKKVIKKTAITSEDVE